MEIQAEVLFKNDNLGRITEINERPGINAPLFFLGRTHEGNVVRFNAALPDTNKNELIEVINQNPTNVDLAKLVMTIRKVKAISHFWMGPAYVFFENFIGNSDAIKITNENKGLLKSSFPNLLKQIIGRQPILHIS